MCLIWKPVSYSNDQDSTLTVAEIRDANARQKAYCKGK